MDLVVFLSELMLWKHYTRKNKNINVFHSEKLQWKTGLNHWTTRESLRKVLHILN